MHMSDLPRRRRKRTDPNIPLTPSRVFPVQNVPETRERLRAKIMALGGVEKAAAVVGISIGNLNKYLRGVQDPSIVSARRIEIIFDIPMQDWTETPRTEALTRIAV